MVTSDDGVAGKPFWENNELLPCWIVERFFLSEKHIQQTHIKNRTNLPRLFPRIKSVDRNVSK